MKPVQLALRVSVVALISAAATSQLNTDLMARFDPAGQSYNDVWGYASPSGGEYALLGSRSGTFVLDCTDPSNPVQRGFFSGPTSTWRDIRTYGDHAYVVTEGGGGVQILDLSDPDNPTLANTWGQAFWSSAHNVAIDTSAGVLYACGTNQGVQIVDLTQDPTSPSLLGNYNISYVHDLHVENGLGHLGEFNSSRYRLMDFSNPAGWVLLGATNVGSCHNVWPTRDANFAVTTSERTGGRMTVVDISDKNNPSNIGTWGTGTFTTRSTTRSSSIESCTVRITRRAIARST